MNWHMRNMQRRKCHSHIWHHVWNGTCELWKDAQVTSMYGTMYEVELLLRFCRTRSAVLVNIAKFDDVQMLEFHPRFLKRRHRGVSVRARPWMIAYSYSGGTTNTKTSLTVHKSHKTQICPQIFTNILGYRWLDQIGEEWSLRTQFVSIQ